jgi:CBS domain containing-hemolysin-like protein
MLTAASAFSSCSEIAFFSLPASRRKSYAIDPNPKKRQVAKLLVQSTSLLVTIFMLNTIVNILLQSTASGFFDQFGGGWVLKVILPLLLVLFIGELIPKYYGLLYNERLALFFVWPVTVCQTLATPLRIALTAISRVISRALFSFLQSEAPLSKQELQHILQTSEGKGLLHQAEAELIVGVLSLEEKQAKELMIPKTNMPMYDIKEPISKLIHLFSIHNTQEIAVFEQPEEKLLGVISSVDLFTHRARIETGSDLLRFLKKPLFVPETTSVQSLLQQLSQKKITTAFVIDEYGFTTGVIRELDLIRQIVKASGSTKPDSKLFKRVAKNAIIADGTLPLADAEAIFDVSLESAYHVVTLGGWLEEKLGTIPKSGTTYQEEGLFFRILSAQATKINTVYVQPLNQAEDDA